MENESVFGDDEMAPNMSRATSSEVDLRPSISGVAKRNKRKMPVRADNSAQLQKALGGLDQCLETIAAVKSAQASDDEFQIFANYVASELRLIPDIQAARRIKRKLQVFFTNSLLELDEMVYPITIDLFNQIRLMHVYFQNIQTFEIVHTEPHAPQNQLLTQSAPSKVSPMGIIYTSQTLNPVATSSTATSFSAPPIYSFLQNDQQAPHEQLFVSSAPTDVSSMENQGQPVSRICSQQMGPVATTSTATLFSAPPIYSFHQDDQQAPQEQLFVSSASTNVSSMENHGQTVSRICTQQMKSVATTSTAASASIGMGQSQRATRSKKLSKNQN